MNIPGHLRGTICWAFVMIISLGFILTNGHRFLPVNFFEGLSALILAMGGAVLWGKIDVPGALIGGVIGIGIFLGGGFHGLSFLLVFFVLGSLASRWRKQEKTRLGLAQENEGKRSVRHAVSNGGAAAICGLLAWGFPEQASIFMLGLAASFASATADTFGSELGNILGSKYVDVLSFQPGTKGEDGVISWEGTAVGALGSLIIALIYGLGAGWGLPVLWICLAGILGNYLDSVLGATVQRRGWLNNDEVNLGSTVLAAGLGVLLAYLF